MLGISSVPRRIKECVRSLILSPCLDFCYFRMDEAASCLERDMTCDNELRKMNLYTMVSYNEHHVSTSLDAMKYEVRKQENKTAIPLPSRSGKE